MSLKFTVDDINSVDEALRPLYVESNGKHVLAVEGAVSKDRLDEFRTSNVATRKELDALRAQYDGVDIEQYRALTTQAEKLRDKKLLDSGKVEEMLDIRVAAMKVEHDKTTSAISKERDTANKQLDSLLIDGKLRDAALKAGVKSTAMDDVLYRGRPVFKRVDGVATAFDGESPIYGKNGDPMSFDEWVSGLSEKAPHLFDTSSGSGAPKGGPASAGGAKTMTRAAFQQVAPMEQAGIIRSGVKIVD